MKKLKFELEITNSQEILETAQRLAEISKELSALAYRLQVKKGVKKEQPPEAPENCSICSYPLNHKQVRYNLKGTLI